MTRARAAGLCLACLLAGFCAGYLPGVTGRKAKAIDRSGVSFLDEADEVTRSFTAQWEAVRDRLPEGRGWDEARAAWRRSYAAEMREVYRRHGREAPAWMGGDR